MGKEPQFDVSALKHQAAGRWLEILSALGGCPAEILNGQHHSCPKCGGTDRFRMIDEEAGALFCNQCFAEKNGDGISALQWLKGWNFATTIKRLAEYLGIKLSKDNAKSKQTIETSTDLRSAIELPAYEQSAYDRLRELWCRKKLPIIVEAMKAYGGMFCSWPKNSNHKFRCFAYAGYHAHDVARGKPVSILLYRVEGIDFPATKTLQQRKTHLIKGSKESWIFPKRENVLQSAQVIVKCEGLTDTLALYSMGLPDGWIAITNSCGAKSANPEKLDFSFAVGKKVYNVGDADKPGQEGAEKFAVAFYRGEAAEVKNIQLPYEVTEDHGKDLRNYFVDGHTMDDFVKLIQDTPAVTIEQIKAVDKQDKKPESLPYMPFPTDMLPKAVADFIHEGSTAMGCDESFVALPGLAMLAACVGNSRRIVLKASWKEPSILWAAVVAPSGTLKSPASDYALAPIRENEKREYADYIQKEEIYRRDKAIFDADYMEWKTKGRRNGEPPPEEPQEPIPTRYVANDVTAEALAVLLQNQPRGLLVAHDELSGWTGSFDAYKSGSGGKDVATWLSLHRAGAVVVDRKSGQKLIRVPRASVSICGGIQPGILTRCLAGHGGDKDEEKINGQEHIENGLLARLLLAMPPRKAKQWSEADVSDVVQQSFRIVVERLLSLDMLTDKNEEPQPRDIPLSRDGKREWIRFYNDHAREEASLPNALAAAWSKLEGYAARFALLIHLIKQVEQGAAVDIVGEIDAESVRSGVALARWFADEAERVYSVLRCNSEDILASGERKLLRIIRDNGGEITARELMHKSRMYRESIEEARTALERLVKNKLGEWGRVDTTYRGGRPHDIFRLFDAGNGNTTPEIPEKNEVVLPLPPLDKGKTTPVDPAVCLHKDVEETPAFDGFINQQCNQCGKNLGCRPAK